MHVRPRSDWGPRHRAGFGAVTLPVAEVWLHHSVAGNPPHDLNAERANMRTLENIGQQRFKGGISYTFVVMPSGRVFEGTGPGRLGAHTGGRNSRSHAICLAGNYDRVGPSEGQQNAIAELLREGKSRNWWREARLNGGHRDVKSTGCPGSAAYRLIPHINSLAAGVRTSPVAPTVSEEDEVIYLFWHKGAVYKTNGIYRSRFGLHPNHIDYIVKNMNHKWLPLPPTGGVHGEHEMIFTVPAD